MGEDEAERFRQLQLDMLRSENKHLDVRLDELTVALHSKLPPMEPLVHIAPFGSPSKPQLQVLAKESRLCKGSALVLILHRAPVSAE